MRNRGLLAFATLLACGAPTRTTPLPPREAPSAAQQTEPAAGAPAKTAGSGTATTCEQRMSQPGFLPGEQTKSILLNLATHVPGIELIEVVTTRGEVPAKKTLSLDAYSDHFIIVCDEGGAAFTTPSATAETPAWLADLQTLHSSCKAVRVFGPDTKSVEYVQTCGSALHLRKPIPKLLAAEQKREAALLKQEQKDREQGRRAKLVETCGSVHVRSCEKRGCVPTQPPIPRNCPGGRNLSDEDLMKLEEDLRESQSKTKARCGCVCGEVELAPPAECEPVP